MFALGQKTFVHLDDRGVVRIGGAEARTFLQGLVTNDVNKAVFGRALYAALLTPQGKYLHDFFIVALPDEGGGEALYLDCERKRAAESAQCSERPLQAVELRELFDEPVTALLQVGSTPEPFETQVPGPQSLIVVQLPTCTVAPEEVQAVAELPSHPGVVSRFCDLVPLHWYSVAIGVGLHSLVDELHRLAFNIQGEHTLSAGIGIDPERVLVVPAIGGLVLGLIAVVLRRFRPNDIVDPVEANALHGGRMSMRDSIRLVVDTTVSNASGVSVGMEAGYSQLGAVVLSKVAQYFRLRRTDHRIFVAAGAGAAIAAAFNAAHAADGTLRTCP